MKDRHLSRGFAAIGLDNPKSGVNVGSALRAAGCYGASMVIASGQRSQWRRMPTDTQKEWRRTPFLKVPDLHDAIPHRCVPVAVDLVDGAVSLTEYVHPERAFYIFGAEDATLGHRVLSWCRDVVYVPTSYCMNLAATVNVVLYDRMAKTGR
jgi:tRNA(Leu) C34 or U34 (ribose-2'-O)-methylase TrmL